MYNEESSPTIENSTFVQNSAVTGGGMDNGYSQATIITRLFLIQP